MQRSVSTATRLVTVPSPEVQVWCIHQNVPRLPRLTFHARAALGGDPWVVTDLGCCGI